MESNPVTETLRAIYSLHNRFNEIHQTLTKAPRILALHHQRVDVQQKALDDVSLNIRAHCITGVIGHTGSGKSTMMQLLNGLATPSSGKVLLDGEDVNPSFEDLFLQWKNV